MEQEHENALADLLKHYPVRAGLAGTSPAVTMLLKKIRSLARSNVPVLLVGEVGSGKENAARALHLNSDRSAGPFVAEAGAALQGGLFLRQLFGHARGAFTGATNTVPGLFDLADGGTLFLDEVGEIPLDAQACLLRVLECGEYRALGSPHLRRSDFRLVASTACNLSALVSTGLFRRELYFRLRGARLTVPPLRERLADIPALAEQFIREAGESTSGAERPELSRSARQALQEYGWPGNVRELRNELRQAVALCDGRQIETSAFTFLQDVPPPPVSQGPKPLRHRISKAEADAIRDALTAAHGNKAEAARCLGMTRRTLYRRMRKLER